MQSSFPPITRLAFAIDIRPVRGRQYMPPFVLQRKEKEEEPQVASVAMLSEYEPVDSEGNPWWEPPQSDFWEGPAWNVSFPVQFAEAFFQYLLESTFPVVMLPRRAVI